VVLLCVLSAHAKAGQASCRKGHFPPSWTRDAPFQRLDQIESRMRALSLNGVTCAARLQSDARGPDAGGEWNWHGESWEESQFLLRCLWIDIFRRAQPATVDCLAAFRLDADDLPSTLALIVSTPEQRGMSEQKSLRAYLPGMTFTRTSETELSAKLDQGDKYEDDVFTLMGTGDFDGDGYRDVVIASRDSSSGTYGELAISVLSRKTPRGVLSHRFQQGQRQQSESSAR
jgi:hypothetical protein